MSKSWLFSLCVASAIWALPQRVSAITLGQIDDFEGGTALNWSGDSGSISNQPTGGPAGVNDNFLRVSSNGSQGPGSRMVTLNATQWAGNYNAAGVSAITLDARNLGSNPLHLRVAFGSGISWFASTNATPLPVGGAWQSVSFDLSAVTQLDGADSLATVLGNVTEVRILSSLNLPTVGGNGARGDRIAGVLGLDNIKAVAPVPEPAALALASGMALALAQTRRRWRRMR